MKAVGTSPTEPLNEGPAVCRFTKSFAHELVRVAPFALADTKSPAHAAFVEAGRCERAGECDKAELRAERSKVAAVWAPDDCPEL